MDVDEVLNQARSAIGAERVFGEPYERDGVTVIPTARVSGGGGGGGGGDESEDGGSGAGAGFGLSARPAGAIVIRGDGSVSWQPAIDPNKVIMGGQLVAIVGLLVLWLTARSRARAAARSAIATAAIKGVRRSAD
jgi:hypothetical protein